MLSLAFVRDVNELKVISERWDILLPTSEGLIVDSVLKLNYIFTVSKNRIKKKLIHLSEEKKNEVCENLLEKFKICIENF